MAAQPVPGSSKHTASGSIAYTLPLNASLGEVTADLDYAWRSAQTLAGFPVAHLP